MNPEKQANYPEFQVKRVGAIGRLPGVTGKKGRASGKLRGAPGKKGGASGISPIASSIKLLFY